MSRFFGKILPEVQRGVEIMPKTRSARPLLPKAWVIVGRLIFAGFFIFLSVNILLKKSLFSLGIYFGFVFFLLILGTMRTIKTILKI